MDSDSEAVATLCTLTGCTAEQALHFVRTAALRPSLTPPLNERLSPGTILCVQLQVAGRDLETAANEYFLSQVRAQPGFLYPWSPCCTRVPDPRPGLCDSCEYTVVKGFFPASPPPVKWRGEQRTAVFQVV